LLARLVASCARGSFSEKTSIQMITLIALFRSIAMKAKPQNQKRKENMNSLTHFKKIPILPLLIALALIALATPGVLVMKSSRNIRNSFRIQPEPFGSIKSLRPQSTVSN
jgi:hypothetical protein